MSSAVADNVIALCAIGALLVSVFVAFKTIRSAQENTTEMRRVATAAERSAEAAAEAVTTQGRIADAIDALSTRSDEQQVDLDQFLGRKVSWSLRHVRGIRYALTNEGTVTAYNVRISAESAARFDEPSMGREWPAGSSDTLLVGGSAQTGTPTLVVEWTVTPDETSPKHTWRRPVFPRTGA